MNVYYNAEYTDVNKHAELICLGLVSETGEELYLEFSDVDTYLISPFGVASVLPDTFLYDATDETLATAADRVEAGKQFSYEFGFSYEVVTQNTAKSVIENWFKQILSGRDSEETIQLVSASCHYDATLFYNLWKGVYPPYLNITCYDIVQDIMKHVADEDATLSTNMRKATSVNPVAMLTEEFNVYIEEYPKHISLYFANVIKSLFEKLNNLV